MTLGITGYAVIVNGIRSTVLRRADGRHFQQCKPTIFEFQLCLYYTVITRAQHILEMQWASTVNLIIYLFQKFNNVFHPTFTDFIVFCTVSGF